MIAVQGPGAPALVAQIAGRPDLLELGRFQYATGQIGGGVGDVLSDQDIQGRTGSR